MSQVELVCDRDGGRLDRFLADRLAQFSRSQVSKWVREGGVVVNGQTTTKTGLRLSVGDVVRIAVPDAEPETIQPWDVPLSVVYEDADCLVLDKPAGLVVHPATSHRQDTLVNALLARYPDLVAMFGQDATAQHRPGIVHRLDRDTSGLLVVARHEAAWRALQQQFKGREVSKAYLTLAHGWLSPPEGQIKAGIGRDPRNRQRMAVLYDGREAITEYQVRQFLFPRSGSLHQIGAERYSLVEVRLLTGRTHQIRVHLMHIGHPVVGDRVYGLRREHLACPRQFLHAHQLGFYRLSDGQWMVFDSPLPDDLRQVLARLQAVLEAGVLDERQ